MRRCVAAASAAGSAHQSGAPRDDRIEARTCPPPSSPSYRPSGAHVRGWRRDRRCELRRRPCGAWGKLLFLPPSPWSRMSAPAAGLTPDRGKHGVNRSMDARTGDRGSDRSETRRDAAAAERSRLPANSRHGPRQLISDPGIAARRAAAFTRREIASGTGWCVSDVAYAAGEENRPLRDRHAATSITAIAAGSFRYRSTHGSALLAPGALLLGNAGSAYECSFEHSPGDRCIHFAYAPDLLEEIAAAVPAVRRTEFRSTAFRRCRRSYRCRCAPSCRRPCTTRQGGRAVACAGRRCARPAGGCGEARRAPQPTDERRIFEVLHAVEDDCAGRSRSPSLEGMGA